MDKYFKILRGSSIEVERQLNHYNETHTINIISSCHSGKSIYITIHVGPLKDNNDGISNSN